VWGFDSHWLQVPDVIALQEVTPVFLEWLLEEDWVREGYRSSDGVGHTLGSGRGCYGIVILIRKGGAALKRFVLHELDSMMDRQLLVAHLDVDGEPMLLGTVHLESLNCPSVREAQLGTIFPILQKGSGLRHSMLVGDMNFGDDASRETAKIPPDYTDAWLETHPGKPGFTMPPHSLFPRWRPDRVLLRSDTFRVESTVIIGWEETLPRCALCPEERQCSHTRPSDHFGLVAHVRLR